MAGGAISPVYVVFGKDRTAILDEIDRITELVLAGADRQLSLSIYDGSAVSLADVLDELRTLPFLSARRLVIIKQADAFISENRKHLERYLDSPSSTGVLLLAPKSFASSTRLAKRTAKVGKVISFELLKGHRLCSYLADYAARRYGLVLTGGVAELLIDLVGPDSGILRSHIDKLAAYLSGPAGKTKKITAEHVNLLVGSSRHDNIFVVIDAMTSGDSAGALAGLDRLFRADRDAKYKAVGAFAWHVRRLYEARILLEASVGESAILQRVRVWSHQREFIRQVRRLRLDRIGDMLVVLANIDYISKTGGLGSVKSGLEKLVVRFCSGGDLAA